MCAALGLEQTGLKVHLATKLRLGDSNTVMAEGGVAASLANVDTVYLDSDDKVEQNVDAHATHRTTKAHA